LKGQEILTALMDAPDEQIDVCIRPSDVPWSYEWNTALKKDLPLYKVTTVARIEDAVSQAELFERAHWGS